MIGYLQKNWKILDMLVIKEFNGILHYLVSPILIVLLNIDCKLQYSVTKH